MERKTFIFTDKITHVWAVHWHCEPTWKPFVKIYFSCRSTGTFSSTSSQRSFLFQIRQTKYRMWLRELSPVTSTSHRVDRVQIYTSNTSHLKEPRESNYSCSTGGQKKEKRWNRKGIITMRKLKQLSKKSVANPINGQWAGMENASQRWCNPVPDNG